MAVSETNRELGCEVQTKSRFNGVTSYAAGQERALAIRGLGFHFIHEGGTKIFEVKEVDTHNLIHSPSSAIPTRTSWLEKRYRR